MSFMDATATRAMDVLRKLDVARAPGRDRSKPRIDDSDRQTTQVDQPEAISGRAAIVDVRAANSAKAARSTAGSGLTAGQTARRPVAQSWRGRISADRLIVLAGLFGPVANACLNRLLTSLHESRRRQAAIERAKYRHLIHDPETGISFSTNTTSQRHTPGE
jgi:hypothetical protein